MSSMSRFRRCFKSVAGIFSGPPRQPSLYAAIQRSSRLSESVAHRVGELRISLKTSRRAVTTGDIVNPNYNPVDHFKLAGSANVGVMKRRLVLHGVGRASL